MPRTTLNTVQIGAGAIQRDDLDATTTTQAVVRKIVQGTNISLTSTGVDSGTGDVTVAVASSPSFTTPNINVAIATSVNKVAITAPATSATLTLADGSTLATSGANSITLTSSGATNVTLPTTGTLATRAGSETLTNKRIDPRVTSISSSATPTPNADTDDMYIITALAVGAIFGAPTGTPVQGQKLVIRVKDNGTARSLGFNAVYRASTDLPLPTTTILGKTMYMMFLYNSTDVDWDLVAILDNF